MIKGAGQRKASWLFEYRQNYKDPTRPDSMPSLFEVAKKRREQMKKYGKNKPKQVVKFKFIICIFFQTNYRFFFSFHRNRQNYLVMV